MNQIKDDAEQFRKLKSELAKEVLQLKSQVIMFQHIISHEVVSWA